MNFRYSFEVRASTLLTVFFVVVFLLTVAAGLTLRFSAHSVLTYCTERGHVTLNNTTFVCEVKK